MSERVIHQGEEGRSTFYFNTTDIALVQHYAGYIPEDFQMTVIATDELESGTVALANVDHLVEEHRLALTHYWEDGIKQAHIMNALEVAAAKKGMPEDEPFIAVMTEDGEIDELLTMGELLLEDEEDGDEL